MAIAFRLRIQGQRRLERALREMNPAANQRIASRGLTRAGLLVQKVAAEEKIQRGGPRGQRPNPPPGPLISRTGTLRRSIRTDRRALPRYVDVGSDLVYARRHEIGDSRMPARPYLRPAAVDSADRIEALMAEAWEEEIRRAARGV